jgi:hypothetical protein
MLVAAAVSQPHQSLLTQQKAARMQQLLRLRKEARIRRLPRVPWQGRPPEARRIRLHRVPMDLRNWLVLCKARVTAVPKRIVLLLLHQLQLRVQQLLQRKPKLWRGRACRGCWRGRLGNYEGWYGDCLVWNEVVGVRARLGGWATEWKYRTRIAEQNLKWDLTI